MALLRAYTLAFLCLVVVFSGCKKNSTSTVTSGTLRKISTTTACNPQRTTNLTFSYGNGNRLARVEVSIADGIEVNVGSITINRNAAGMITSIDYVQGGYTQSNTFFIDPASSHYRYSIGQGDSTAYTYTNGKISSEEYFVNHGSGMMSEGGRLYSYDAAGNITQVQDGLETLTITYDDKTNPLQLSNEAIILNPVNLDLGDYWNPEGYVLAGSNNAKTFKSNSSFFPIDELLDLNSAYAYTNNYPATSTSTNANPNLCGASTTTYHY
jgi:hypothetical protein